MTTTTQKQTTIAREFVLPDGRTWALPVGTIEVLRYGLDAVDDPQPDVQSLIIAGVLAALKKMPVWQWLMRHREVSGDRGQGAGKDEGRESGGQRSGVGEESKGERMKDEGGRMKTLPTSNFQLPTPPSPTMPSEAQREQYSKLAVAECDRRRRRGETMPFDEALAIVCGSAERAKLLLQGPPRPRPPKPAPPHRHPTEQPAQPLTKEQRHRAAQTLLDETLRAKYSRGEARRRPPKPRTQARCDEAARFASDHGLSFEEALELFDAA